MKHAVRSGLGRRVTLLGVTLAATAVVSACNAQPQPTRTLPPNTLYPRYTDAPTTDPSPTTPPAAGGTGSVPGSPGTSPQTPPPTIDPGSQVPIPEEARQHNPDGAAAFVQFLIDETNRAYLDPRPGALLRLCAPDTPPCNSLDEAMVKLARNNKKATGPVIKAEKYLSGPLLPDGAQPIAVDITLLDYEIVDPAHKTTLIKGESKKTYIEVVKWGTEGWKIVGHKVAQ